MHTRPARALAEGRTVRLAESVLGGIVAVLLMAMMLITVVDVVGRYAVKQPVPGAYELIELMLAILIFMALPLVCLKDENITVTVLIERFSRQDPASPCRHRVASVRRRASRRSPGGSMRTPPSSPPMAT